MYHREILLVSLYICIYIYMFYFKIYLYICLYVMRVSTYCKSQVMERLCTQHCVGLSSSYEQCVCSIKDFISLLGVAFSQRWSSTIIYTQRLAITMIHTSMIFAEIQARSFGRPWHAMHCIYTYICENCRYPHRLPMP